MKKRSLFFKVPAALAFAYVCITNIQTVLANKGCLSITDLESMTSANAACETYRARTMVIVLKMMELQDAINLLFGMIVIVNH